MINVDILWVQVRRELLAHGHHGSEEPTFHWVRAPGAEPYLALPSLAGLRTKIVERSHHQEGDNTLRDR